MTAIRKVVFPVAGLGTRLLPATKAMPKEMLPVVDKPLIQYALEEAAAAGMRGVRLRHRPRQDADRGPFRPRRRAVRDAASARARSTELAALERGGAARPARIVYTRQQAAARARPRRLVRARTCVGDEPFAVMLVDDLIHADDAVHGAAGRGLRPHRRQHRRGDGRAARADRPLRHPRSRQGRRPAGRGHGAGREARARGGAVAARRDRPLHPEPEVFDHLGEQERGAGGEIQLTDAMARLIGGSRSTACASRARRFDCGDKPGYLEANRRLRARSARICATASARSCAASSDPAAPGRRARNCAMRIAMIGTGYVGLVSGACFSEFGLEVTCVDKDAGKIDALQGGRDPDLRARPRRAGRAQHGRPAGCLHHRSRRCGRRRPTRCSSPSARPSRRGDGHADLTYVFAAAEEIADALDGYDRRRHQVDRAGRHRARGASRSSAQRRPDAEFDVASNPEFLREGSAIEDFMRPDRVVLGAESERAREVLRELYRPLYLIETPILFTTLETSELIKYAANTFLATKITFINEIADLCEQVGADVQEVARGIGPRRPHRPQVPACRARLWRLLLPQGHAGAGAHRRGCATRRCASSRAVVDVNDGRKRRMARKIVDALRRRGRRQDDRRARPDLQAQHRRHARSAEPRHRAGAAGRGRQGARLRSRGHGRGAASCCPTSTGAATPTRRWRAPTRW